MYCSHTGRRFLYAVPADRVGSPRGDSAGIPLGCDSQGIATGGVASLSHIGIKLSERLVCAKSGSPFRLVG